MQAAIAREQLKKLISSNNIRLDYINYLINGLKDVDFLKPLLPREKCFSTYYVMPIRFNENLAGVKRNEFVKAVNAEGALFYQGYTRPLYLQPIFQKKIATI